MKQINYLKDLEINPEDLENEWLRRGHNFMKYAEILADVEEEKNNAKNDAEIVRATAAKEIRSNPKKFGLDVKPSDKRVKDEVELRESVRLADRKINALTKRESILKNVVKEMGSYRRAALENLTSMRLAGYSMTKQFKKAGMAKTSFADRRSFFEQKEEDAAQRARYVLNKEDDKPRKIIRRRK